MIISQFSSDPLLINIGKRYRAWHTINGSDGFPSRQIPMGRPGSGREFLQFHRSLLDEFFAWNTVHHAVEAKDLAPWTAIPSELKVPETGWPIPWAGADLAVAEVRVSRNAPPFSSDDELGILLENTIISWIHGAVAAAPAFNLKPAEQQIITNLTAPESTWFYKIHGLAHVWWLRLLYPVSAFKENNDFCASGRGFKEINDWKEINDLHGSGRGFKEINDWKEINDLHGSGRGFKEINDWKEINDLRGSASGFKEANDFKEIVDNPGGKQFKELLDVCSKQTALPSFLNNLLARVKELEARLKVKKSPFIKPFQRPPVGRAIIRSKRKKNR
jgi:hypothetical protein